MDLSRDRYDSFGYEPPPPPPVITVPYGDCKYSGENPEQDEIDRKIAWYLSMFSLIAYISFSFGSSSKKRESIEAIESLALTLFASMHSFCGEELLHLLTCLGTYEHKRPLAYWYRIYTVLGTAGRIPIFFYGIQPMLADKAQFLFKDEDWAPNFMSLMLAYILLNSFSRLYSELINPKHLLTNTQREIFFKWQPNRNYSPEASPCSSPPGTPSRAMLSTISERSEDSTPERDTSMAEDFMRYGLMIKMKNT